MMKLVKSVRSKQRLELLRIPAGFTLIEVLIAVLVLSIGMAGLATLYLTSLASVHSGLQSSLASAIALDFEERLWLEVGRAGDSSCPDGSAVASELISTWDGSIEGFLSLPGLQITAGAPKLGARFKKFPVTVTWTETRFASDEGSGEENNASPTQEVFNYIARVYCTPGSQ